MTPSFVNGFFQQIHTYIHTEDLEAWGLDDDGLGGEEEISM